MTNHSSHFKQLELSLAINHLDTCYCARNRAAFRREESRAELWEQFSTFGPHTIVKQTQGLGHIVAHSVVCFYDLNKNQSENNKGLYFLCTVAQGIWCFLWLLLKNYLFFFLFYLFFYRYNFFFLYKIPTVDGGVINMPWRFFKTQSFVFKQMWHRPCADWKWNVANLHLTSVWSTFKTLFSSQSQTTDKLERGNSGFFPHLNNMEKKGLAWPRVHFLSSPANCTGEQRGLATPLKMVLNRLSGTWQMMQQSPNSTSKHKTDMSSSASTACKTE